MFDNFIFSFLRFVSSVIVEKLGGNGGVVRLILNLNYIEAIMSFNLRPPY